MMSEDLEYKTLNIKRMPTEFKSVPPDYKIIVVGKYILGVPDDTSIMVLKIDDDTDSIREEEKI